MKNVRMPDGSEKPLEEIIEDLKTDGIELSHHNTEVFNFLGSYENSITTRKIMANRYTELDPIKNLKTTKLSDILTIEFLEEALPHLKDSYDVINRNIYNNEKILLVSDYDNDGITSAAIAHKMLQDVYGYDNVEVMVNQRAYGNGINRVITDKILNYCKEEKVGLIITSDHGSHNRDTIYEIMKETGADVIVTDHHLFNDEDAPLEATAFINPQRYETGIFKDMTGAGIVYFTLLYSKLKHGDVTTEEWDRIYYLLNYVGLTIISDCMDLKNYVNRIILDKMFSNINSRNIEHDPFWQVVIKENANSYMVDETTLGYNVIPLLNSPGRVADPRLSYEVMMSTSYDIAKMLYDDIIEINKGRKELQTKATNSSKIEEYSDGVIKVMMVSDSEGVQGIVANNVMYDENYKIVIVFTKQRRHDGYIYVGSGRSQEEGLNLGDIVTTISEQSDLIIQHGGHAAAIGIKMKPELKEFYNLLKAEVSKHKVVEKKIEYIEDYIFSTKKLLLTIFDVINAGPFGIGYEKPIFASDFYIESYRIYKRNNILLSFKVKFSKTATSTMNVFYSIKKSELDEVEEKLKTCKYIRMSYSFNVNSFRNKNKILLNPTKLLFK